MAMVYGLTYDRVAEQVDMLRAGWGGGNLAADLTPVGRDGVRVNLRVLDARGPWARRSTSGRRMRSACWHAWGNLFDRLLGCDGLRRIETGPFVYRGRGDNWQDWNCGSQVRPVMISECCDCGKGE